MAASMIAFSQKPVDKLKSKSKHLTRKVNKDNKVITRSSNYVQGKELCKILVIVIITFVFLRKVVVDVGR